MRLPPSIVFGTLLIGSVARMASAQSVGFSAIPSAAWYNWSGRLPLEDNWLYGGRLAIQFGPAVELQPFYYFRNNQPLDLTKLGRLIGPRAGNRSLDVEHYGAQVQLNFAQQGFVPFVRGGGGIVRFTPDSGGHRERITLSGGGGLRFAVGGFSAEVYAEQLALRLDPRSIFGADSGVTRSRATQRSGIYGASVRIPLSALPNDDRPTGGLVGTSLVVKPFAGRLALESRQGSRRNQDLVGARLGLELSSLVGVSGFYWRGVNEDRDDFIPVEAWGGEAQFNFGTGPGLNPFLVAGAARLNRRDAVPALAAGGETSQNALIVGGGATIRLSPRIGLDLAVRDYVFAKGNDIADVTTADDLSHNPLYSVGLTIGLGGRSKPERTREPVRAERRDRNDRDRDEDEPRDGKRQVRDDDRDRARDSLPPAMDSLRREIDSLRREVARRDLERASRVITVPVPEEGEVILRYGRAALQSDARLGELRDTTRVTRDTARTTRDTTVRRDSVVKRDTVVRRDVPAAPRDTGMQGAMTSTLEARLADLERRLSAQIAEMRAQGQPVQPAPSTPPIDRVTVVPLPGGTSAALVDDRVRGVPLLQRFGQTTSRDLRPFIGVGGREDNIQFVTSLRADLGPITPDSRWRFVPELAVGFGEGGTSVLALATAQYGFAGFAGSTRVRPYLAGGVGVFSPTVLGLSTAVGTSVDLRSRGRLPLFLYGELQGINLFNRTRVLVGLSTRP
ncbi:MAG: hypothetical protein MUE41_05655 [Gemmatimonadaceae bacterium]|nr:hypothetical protein [Gemmatimonadaceae bacterium]